MKAGLHNDVLNGLFSSTSADTDHSVEQLLVTEWLNVGGYMLWESETSW